MSLFTWLDFDQVCVRDCGLEARSGVGLKETEKFSTKPLDGGSAIIAHDSCIYAYGFITTSVVQCVVQYYVITSTPIAGKPSRLKPPVKVVTVTVHREAQLSRLTRPRTRQPPRAPTALTRPHPPTPTRETTVTVLLLLYIVLYLRHTIIIICARVYSYETEVQNSRRPLSGGDDSYNNNNPFQTLARAR